MTKPTQLKLADVAKGAQVSLSTASRYFSGIKIRADAAQRIENFLNQYKRDASNRHIPEPGERKLPVIAAIVPELGNFFYTATVNGILEAANRLGYHILLAQTQRSIEVERRLLAQFAQQNIEGLIFIPTSPLKYQFPEASELLHRLPVVICNRHDMFDKAVHVYVDNVQAGYQATRFMISRGRRNIGFILGTPSMPFSVTEAYEIAMGNSVQFGGFTSADRLRGYLMALEEAGSYSPALVSVAGWDVEGGAKSAAELLGKAPYMDGLITTSDLLAACAVTTIQQRGYDIPHDVSIIGWGNTELATLTTPTLTSISNPTYEIGYSSVAHIDKLLHGEQVSDMMFDATLVPRNSTIIKA